MSGVMEQFIAALNRHSDVMEKFVAKEAGAKAAATPGAAAGAAKPAAAAAKPAAAKPKATGPTLEEMQAKFGEYLSVQDKAVRAERKGHIANIAAHWGVERATLVPEANWPEALELLAQYEAGKDPFAQAGDEAEEEQSPI